MTEVVCWQGELESVKNRKVCSVVCMGSTRYRGCPKKREEHTCVKRK